MKNKIIAMVFYTLLIINPITCVLSRNNDENLQNYELLNESRIVNYNDFKLIYINGSNYEMGYQHGYLLKDEIKENFRAFLNYTQSLGWDYEFYCYLWDQFKDYVPEKYLNELHGISDGSGLSLLNISIQNIMIDWFHCCEAAAWGPATSDGNLIYIRSFDWPMEMIDPISGKSIKENQILMIRNPDNGYASIEPSLSGFIGGPGGVNENGVSIGMICSYTFDDIDSGLIEGIPISFRIKMVLDNASNALNAIKIINSNKTCGYNFIISDVDRAYVTEQNHSMFYNGTWNSNVESNSPFWSIDHVIRRTNIFINKSLAENQRKKYNPSIFPLLKTIFKLNPVGYKTSFSSSTSWLHYFVLSRDIEKIWGKIDLNNSMEMLRNLYNGKTNFRFFLLRKLGVYIPLHQWVFNSKTGDLLISFSNVEKDACENSIYGFNIFELIYFMNC